MLEFPEVKVMSEQLNNHVVGRQVQRVMPPTKVHKFCWFNGEPGEYGEKLKGSRITGAEGFGIFVEISFDNGYKLCVNDGINLRLVDKENRPKDFQLLIEFEEGEALVFTVAMYGGIYLHQGEYDNSYYLASKGALSPFLEVFKTHYKELFAKSKPSLSLKAFLATEQRFPGIGNGVLQDILFEAGMHPKRKLQTLSEEDKEKVLRSITEVLQKMIQGGGRDTEKDLMGQKGGYKTLMSKNTMALSCPKCGAKIIKEAYLGGSVYYCEYCQPFVK